MRPVIKIEDGIVEVPNEKAAEEDVDHSHALLRRRLDDDGAAAADETQLLRALAKAREQAVVTGQELQKAQDAIVRSKDEQLRLKDVLLQAKDAEILRLRAELAWYDANDASGDVRQRSRRTGSGAAVSAEHAA
jgi:hypothetical protein